MKNEYLHMQISDSELALMRIIWARGGTALFAQVMEELESKGVDWKKNTVLTFLSRLTEKKLLSIKKIGHRNEYAALISEDDYLTMQTRTFLNKVYEGNVKGLVATLVQQELLSSDEVQELRKMWAGGDSIQ